MSLPRSQGNGAASLRSMSAALRRNCTLLHLHLEGFQCENAPYGCLIDSIAGGFLRSVDLSGMSSQVGSLARVCAAIGAPSCCCLQELKLNDLSIPSGLVTGLCRAMTTNPSLLRLSGNQFMLRSVSSVDDWNAILAPDASLIYGYTGRICRKAFFAGAGAGYKGPNLALLAPQGMGRASAAQEKGSTKGAATGNTKCSGSMLGPGKRHGKR